MARPFPANQEPYDGGTSVTWQPSLLGGVAGDGDGDAGSTLDARFASLRRIWLDDTSWVDHAPGWLPAPDQLFELLAASVPWRQRSRQMFGQLVAEPRLTHWMGHDTSPGWPEPVEAARRVLSTRYQVAFDTVGLNLYRDGRDSVAWHRDTIPAEITDPMVAVVSLGHPRRFLLRPRGGGRGRAVLLASGDLLVTGGAAQRRWEHTVPKAAGAGPRISLAFRPRWCS